MAAKHIVVKTKSTAKKPKVKKTKTAEVSAPLMNALDALATMPSPSLASPPVGTQEAIERHCLRRVFHQLMKLAALPAAMNQPLISAEAMYEHNLYTIQNYLKHVLEDTASTLGEDEKTELAERFKKVNWNFGNV